MRKNVWSRTTLVWGGPSAAGLCASLLLGLCACDGGTPSKETPPASGAVEQREAHAKHMIIITIDAMRADRLSCYGNQRPTSPNIDRLAANGAIFTNASVPRALTRPSMTSFFSSRYPSEHGVLTNRHVVPDDERLLAEHLEEAGFRTSAMVTASTLSTERSNLGQGFSYFKHIPSDEQLTRRAEVFLEKEFGQGGRREFLWLHYMSTHLPYDPPPPFDTKFCDPDFAGTADGSKSTIWQAFSGTKAMSPADHQRIVDLYDGCVAAADAWVARIQAALEASGAADDTLLVITSDHGEELSDHNGFYGHRLSPYIHALRVPMIFSQPNRIPAGTRIDGLMTSLDLMPSALSWLGLPPSERARGFEFTDAILNGKASPRRFAMREMELEGSFVWGIRDMNWSWVYNPEDVDYSLEYEGTIGHYPIPKEAMYPLDADRSESVNMIVEKQDLARSMLKELELWRSDISRADAELDLDSDFAEELEQLGYLGYE